MGTSSRDILCGEIGSAPTAWRTGKRACITGWSGTATAFGSGCVTVIVTLLAPSARLAARAASTACVICSVVPSMLLPKGPMCTGRPVFSTAERASVTCRPGFPSSKGSIVNSARQILPSLAFSAIVSITIQSRDRYFTIHKTPPRPKLSLCYSKRGRYTHPVAIATRVIKARPLRG